MKFWPEVHWSEGLFLRPHTLQAAFRHVETMRGALLDALHPFGWGFLALDLASESVENNIIELRSCELILRDGTIAKVPENCSVDPRDFKAAFDKASGPMPLFFGVPSVQAVRPNVQRPGELLDGRSPRYSVDLTERYDENTGENPQTIEVRRLRGAFFFGQEDQTGYECARIGQIERSAAGPTLVQSVIPPILRLQAWGPLCAALDGLWNEIRGRSEQLGGDASERQLTYATGSPGDIEQLVKLQALNELTVRFGALTSAPETHPYTLYLALCDAIGRVALWDDSRRPRELPAYVHTDVGPVFHELFRYLRTLINGMLPKDYIERPFEVLSDGFKVELDYEWFTPNHELYLGIRSPELGLEDLVGLFRSINFKLASPRDAIEVYRRRLPGLEFKTAGTVPNLPKSSDLHFFRISRTPPYWEHCESERGILIALPPAELPKLSALRLSLFVVKVR